jgi:hypothetical protein
MSVLSIDRPDIGHFQWRESWARGNRKITLVTIFKLVHPIRYHNVALPRKVREFQTRHAGINQIPACLTQETPQDLFPALLTMMMMPAITLDMQ